ncbi:Arm DNA-binding domain-containing protein [Variovorax sp. LARHSF232]
MYAGCKRSLGRFHTNKTSKGVRFHPPDALFHWANASCPPGRKQARYADASGFYLEVSASGSRRWFWTFRIEGVEKKFALGSYPDVSLAAARRVTPPRPRRPPGSIPYRRAK